MSLSLLAAERDWVGSASTPEELTVGAQNAEAQLRRAATLRDPVSGRTLEILTDQPSIQVYMGNFLDGSLTGKQNAGYGPNAAICLETQKFPDSIHHADWPSVRLDPGETYRHVMVHRFTR